MPSIYESIVELHNIILCPNAKPIKQNISKMNTKVALLIKIEIKKILKYGFTCSIDYSTWISNIVFVNKLDGRICICIDFWDLNNASLQDDFLLPNIDMIVDSTIGHLEL